MRASQHVRTASSEGQARTCTVVDTTTPLGSGASGEQQVAIQLVTFGGLHAVDDTGEAQRLLGQHSRAALFVYLVIERRVSREALIALFWPESDSDNARHALRQSLYQLRKAVGVDWIESRPHELVVTGEVGCDANDFTRAQDEGDLAAVVGLYRGPFLEGVHLIDLKPWESWVDSRRSQYARSFRRACRDLVESRRAAGELQGAIEAAERWTARDPLDGEAQHRLIETLAAAGERAEAIRQYETYLRLLDPEELVPRDETRELVERLRSKSPPLPAPSLASKPAPRPPPAEPIVARQSTSRNGLWARSALMVSVMVLAATLWALRSNQVVRSPSLSSTTIAVLPFSVRGDEAYRYLGEGMVNLLGTALDGAGSLRPADSRATFASVVEAGDPTPRQEWGNRVARRLGSGLFVSGDVVEAGGMLQIQAAVYPVGARSAQPRATAAVSGRADSVFTLVDRLAARLLASLGDPAADRLLRTAAMTTSSLPAFKTYLSGEASMRAGQFERAADDYLAAISLDSTFALAHYRLALAREWAPLPGEEDAARAAARHGARLSARDRMLLEAFRQWRIGDAIQADRAYHAILSRYPDDVDAWFQLGEIQFHHGPLLGYPIGASEEAWRKVLSYEPRNLFALTHLARIAAMTERGAALDSLLALFDPEELRSDRRLEELQVLRAVARRDTAGALALVRGVKRGESFAVWRVAVFLTAFTPDPAIMRRVIEELTEDYANAGLRADLHWFASQLDLAAGRVADATADRLRAVEAEHGASPEYRRPGFASVTEWFAATLPLPYADSTLARVRQSATAEVRSNDSRDPFVNELAMGRPIQREPVRQYTLGIISVRLRDTVSAASAAAKLERLASSGSATALVRDLDRGLRARLAWRRGRPEEALRLVDSLELRDSQGDVAVTPFVTRVNERFLRAEILASLGRDSDALRWLASLGSGSVTEIALLAPSHLRQAEILERLGRREEAIEHYARFLALWRNADPMFRPAVEQARARLARLSR